MLLVLLLLLLQQPNCFAHLIIAAAAAGVVGGVARVVGGAAVAGAREATTGEAAGEAAAAAAATAVVLAWRLGATSNANMQSTSKRPLAHQWRPWCQWPTARCRRLSSIAQIATSHSWSCTIPSAAVLRLKTHLSFAVLRLKPTASWRRFASIAHTHTATSHSWSCFLRSAAVLRLRLRARTCSRCP